MDQNVYAELLDAIKTAHVVQHNLSTMINLEWLADGADPRPSREAR